VTAVVGDGRLTAGFNTAGHLTTLTWPGPGLHDHVTLSRETMPRLGAWWALETQGQVHVVESPRAAQRFVETRAPILEIVHRIEGTRLVCLQTAFTVPGRDLLVWRLEVLGAGGGMRAALFCAASPAKRKLPPVPLPAAAFDEVNAFAMFIDRGEPAAFALRPDAPGRREWERARAFAAEGALPRAWEAFDGGAWLAVGPAADGGAVAITSTEASRQPAALFAPAPRAAAVGPGALVVLPPVHTSNGRAEATAFIALGTSRAETAAALSQARALGYQALYDETVAAWQDRLTMKPLTGAQAALSPWVTGSALIALHLATHTETGAIAQAPAPSEHATVHPRDAGWLALALALAGQPEAAANHLRFLAGHVRAVEQSGAPYGSLPARLYTNGETAAPDAVLDLDATGWWLSACQRYGLEVTRREEVRLYRELWPAVARAGEFIAAWTDPATDAFLPTWQPDRMRDGGSVETMLAGFMGLLAAEHIAITLGEEALPEWRLRRRALEAALQIRFYRHAGPWPIDPALRYWLDGVTPPDHWLRRPMRVGSAVWTPLGEAALPPASETFAPVTHPLYFTQTREAAMHLISAYAAETPSQGSLVSGDPR
jgi:hypothetical protein